MTAPSGQGQILSRQCKLQDPNQTLQRQGAVVCILQGAVVYTLCAFATRSRDRMLELLNDQSLPGLQTARTPNQPWESETMAPCRKT